MSDARPVGFFDSGVGGMCILDAFRRLCPAESTVYIADSANCPYGNRPAEEIVRLSEANVEELLSRGCKAVVVACNTATAAAIDYLRRRYADVPFVGLEPAVKPAALRSRTGVVGVLATEGTFGGRLYNETKEKFARDVVVIATVADEFVALVERGETSGPAAEAAVRARLTPLIDAGCDMIVLGCTHFPAPAAADGEGGRGPRRDPRPVGRRGPPGAARPGVARASRPGVERGRPRFHPPPSRICRKSFAQVDVKMWCNTRM